MPPSGSPSRPVFARAYAVLAQLGERSALGRWRTEVLAAAQGRLLIVGLGPGHDLDHLPPAVTEVVAVEPNPSMRRQAAGRTANAPVPVTVLDATAEDLPLDDASVDTVLCALVLCSVAEPTGAVAEIRRVLRPGGRLLLLEHVAATPGSRLARVQQTLDPLWQRIAGGCHLTRDTRGTVRAAGFDDEALRDLPLRAGLPWCVPHVRGAAVAPRAVTADPT